MIIIIIVIVIHCYFMLCVGVGVGVGVGGCEWCVWCGGRGFEFRGPTGRKGERIYSEINKGVKRKIIKSRLRPEEILNTINIVTRQEQS